MFGVGGGFLITPILMMLGIPSVVAAASGSNQMIAASASGTYTHWKLGNVDFKMGTYLLIGSFMGGALGVQLVAALKALGNVDFLIKITYVVVPILIGGYMFVESLQSMRKAKSGENAEKKAPKEPSGFKKFLKALPFQTDFKKSGVRHSVMTPIVIGILVGILSAIMGVGGGFIMVPIMLYLLDMPILVVVGTSLFQVLFLMIYVTFLQAYTNHAVDFILALLMLIGSSLGAQIGAIISKKLPAERLKILLAVLVLGIGIKVLFDVTMGPSILLARAGG